MRWQKHEDDYLIENFHKISRKQLGSYLNRSSDSVKHRTEFLRKLGHELKAFVVKAKPKIEFWDEPKNAYIIANYGIESIENIANTLNIPRRKLSIQINKLKKNGVMLKDYPKPPKKPGKYDWNDEDIEFLKKNAPDLSIYEIIDNLTTKRSYYAVRNKLNKLNLKFVSNHTPEGTTKYHHNEDYFSVVDNDRCYWAGWLAADGCITHSSSGKPLLNLTLKRSDEEVIQTFANDISWTGPLRRYDTPIIKITGKKYPYSSLVVSGAEKFEIDLKNNYNITRRKSLTLEPPDNLSQEQSLYFIKGYIEGDGCVCKFKDKSMECSFLGTPEFLQWADTILKLQIPKLKTKIYNRKVNGKAWILEIGGAGRVIAMCELFTSLKSPYHLDRKWSKGIEQKLLWDKYALEHFTVEWIPVS